MSGITAIVPVKEEELAKQRLSGLLSSDERITLARAMLEDLLTAVRESEAVRRILAVTPDREKLDSAIPPGIEVLREPPSVRGLNAAIGFAAGWCGEAGDDGILILPLDLPLASAQDIDTIVSAAPSAPSATLVASRDGDGTNALLVKPPASLPFAYGPGSFRAHLGAAVGRGLTTVVLELPNIALDVDRPDDLWELLERPGSSRAQTYMRTLNLNEREAP